MEGQLWLFGTPDSAEAGPLSRRRAVSLQPAPGQPCSPSLSLPKGGRVRSHPSTLRQSSQCPVPTQPPCTHLGGEQQASLSSDLGHCQREAQQTCGPPGWLGLGASWCSDPFRSPAHPGAWPEQEAGTHCPCLRRGGRGPGGTQARGLPTALSPHAAPARPTSIHLSHERPFPGPGVQFWEVGGSPRSPPCNGFTWQPRHRPLLPTSILNSPGRHPHPLLWARPCTGRG